MVKSFLELFVSISVIGTLHFNNECIWLQVREHTSRTVFYVLITTKSTCIKQTKLNSFKSKYKFKHILPNQVINNVCSVYWKLMGDGWKYCTLTDSDSDVNTSVGSYYVCFCFIQSVILNVTRTPVIYSVSFAECYICVWLKRWFIYILILIYWLVRSIRVRHVSITILVRRKCSIFIYVEV